MKKEKIIAKAFRVTPHWCDEYEGQCGDIIYSETAGKAKYEFFISNDLDMEDWFKAKVVRDKDFDKFEPIHHELVKELTKKQIDIIAHMNGNNYDKPGSRNHYCAGTEDLVYFEKLTQLGITSEPTKHSLISENQRYFWLTELGKKVAFSLLPIYRVDYERMQRCV